MRIRIVCCEDINAWILGKFARRLRENLIPLGVEADIRKIPDPRADINHHIIYLGYDGKKTSTDTIMITHVDTEQKLYMLKNQLLNAEMGICMSSDTVKKLVGSGVPGEKLCYVNPAHDGVIKPRKIVVGITSKVQSSGCKREFLLTQLADRISPSDFKFKIMGSGWESSINALRQKGIEVDYYARFDYSKYCEIIPCLDYYLYFGQDEGSMGFVDALAAGIPTIVTPQGFHLDAPGGITYAFNEIEELEKIFLKIIEEKKNLARAVSSWTWHEYARKHLLIWKYLLRKKTGQTISEMLSRELEKPCAATINHMDGKVPAKADGRGRRFLRTIGWLREKLKNLVSRK
ncbi:MAG: hypothetical protein PHV55_06310 [Candidatus Omnitrophica bacterium]|nr:hypothetical protein [Candidatus Omnitrophota bacterium]